MADTKRCPMCGKPNPADAEVCKYCKAQIKPILGNEQPSPETPAARDEMDWLRSLADSAETAPNETPAEQPPASEEDEDFLLDRLRASSLMDAEAPQPEKSTPPEPAASEEEGNAEWLRILEESSARKADAAHHLPEEETPDLDSWLESLDKGDQSEEPPAPQETGGEPSPEKLTINGRLKDSGIEPEDGSAAWLNSLRSDSDLPEDAEEISPSPFISTPDNQADSVPDWLNAETPFPEEEPDKALSDLPDWLTEEGPEEESAQPQESVPETDLPDWLQEMSPAGEESDKPLSDLPDWLSEEGPEEEPAQPQESAPKADLPDWLQEMSPAGEEPAPLEPAGGMDELPPWMRDETEDIFEPGFDLSEHAAPESDDLSDLLSGFEKQGEATGLGPDEGIPLPEEPASPFISAFTEEETVPSSSSPFMEEDLKELLGEAAEEEPPAGTDAFAVSPFSDDELPDWSKTPEEELETASEEDEDYAHPFAADNLPDWLKEEEVGEILPAEPEKDQEEEEIAPAQLPGWLAAMRPVEAVAPETSASLDEVIEKSGPLAGLRGVLPADRQTIQYRKPPVYSAKLDVSERQAAHAGLLEDLISGENKARTTKRESAQGSKRLVQLIVALVLIVVLIAFRGAGSLVDIPSRPYLSPFVTAFYHQIESLPAGSPVLLAVDYDPGYAGEMRAASNAVIQRLMHNKQRLAAISTVPAGPALAEDLLQYAYTNQEVIDPAYTFNENTINLGYLPGGNTSLKEFSLQPRQAARYGLTSTYDGLIPWDHPSLAGVTSLTDFKAVIVITDSVDTGRAWVEQVQPALGTTPMLLISSAQAAPMLEPYLQSGQFSGMISGLAGSVAYENTLQQPNGTGHHYWIAYQGGIAVVIALVLVGILLQLIVILFASRKPQSEA